MEHLIKSIDAGSPCDGIGINSGDYLLAIDGNEIIDIIDYEQLTCCEHITVLFKLQNGQELEADIEKDMYTPLGLSFESSLMSPVKQCKNHCLFCFIDQMCASSRKSLHFKDDDWRLSLIMGNYVTLTNVDDEEFERIIKRRVSPLYISVHATDAKTRQTMMRNPASGLIMQRLKRLKEAGLRFHSQIVLCPTINDGKVLEQTIYDLKSLYPAAQSVAVVPVGLTKHREGLYPLRCLTHQEARETIRMIEDMQKQFLKELDTRFVFASDEMYMYCKMPLPNEESFEDYPQIENGVGLLRKFESEFTYETEEQEKRLKKITGGKQIVLHGATGVSAYPFLSELFAKLHKYGIDIYLHPITNRYFGETITVSGLVCATDIIEQLENMGIEHLILPRTMLRENADVFLDGRTVLDLKNSLGCDVYPLPCYDGGVFLNALMDSIEKMAKG